MTCDLCLLVFSMTDLVYLTLLSGATTQKDTKVPTDAWEYLIRRALNDAAYNNLDYVAYCPHTPCCSKGPCKDAKFLWVSKRTTLVTHSAMLPDKKYSAHYSSTHADAAGRSASDHTTFTPLTCSRSLTLSPNASNATALPRRYEPDRYCR